MSNRNQFYARVVDSRHKFRTKDINFYVQHYIRQRLGGFDFDDHRKEFKYLLKNKFEDLDGPYRALYIDGVDHAGPLPFDYYFDKSKQPPPNTGEPDNRSDVFDELLPILLAENICRAKILFPYNKANNYWLVGELVLSKIEETITVRVLAHDPYGKGKLSNMKFKALEVRLKKTFSQFNVEVSSEISQYTSNRLSLGDVISSGVIVAHELVKRIENESLTLSFAYPVGARQLRESQICFLMEDCNEEVQSYLEHFALDEVKNIEDSQISPLSIEEIRTKTFEILDSNFDEKDKVEKLLKIENDFYKPLVIQLAHQSSFEELNDLVIVFNDLTLLAISLSDLSSQLEYLTEAAVFCQYVKILMEEKFSAEHRDKFSELHSIKPTQRWYEIQEKLVAKIGGKTELLADMQRDAKEYRQKVTGMRNEARKEFEMIDMGLEQNEKTDMDELIVKPVRDLFHRIAEDMKSLLAKLYDDSQKMMATPPPSRYAIIGLGSLALQQITPYSDFEFAILTELDAHENPEIIDYFTKLSHLANFKTIGLGETIIPTSKFNVDLAHLVHVGINFDLGGKTPLGRKDKSYSLVKTVRRMMKFVVNKDDKITHIDKCLPYILENVCYVSGHRGLVEEYQKQVTSFLNQRNFDGQKNCEVRALKILQEGAVEFDYANKQPNVEIDEKKFEGDLEKLEPKLTQSEGKYFNVKQEIYRMSDRMIYNLGLYFGIEGTSCWDTIDKLMEAEVINARAHENLQYAVSFANLLRLKTYFKNEAQTGEISIYPENSNSSESNMLELTKNDLAENGQLFNYFYRAFPLYKKLEEFCSEHEQLTPSEKRFFFQNELFLDKDSATKGLIYFRLNQYENALTHLDDALQTSNHNSKLAILEVMGDAYLDLDDYNKASDLFGTLKKEQEAFSCPTLQKLQVSKKIGRLLYLKDNYDEAFDCLTEVLKEEEVFYGNNLNSAIANTLEYIGDVYKSKSDYKSAKEYFEKSLNIRLEVSKGLPNLDVASSLISIAGVHSTLSEFELAINNYEKSLKIQTTYFKGAPNLTVASTLSVIGIVCAKQGDLRSALRYHEQHFQMIKVMFQRVPPPRLAFYLGNIGEIYQSKGEHDLALKYYKESLGIRKTLFNGVAHLSLNASLNNVGVAYQYKGEYDVALKYFIESSEMQAIIFKNTAHPSRAQTLNNIGFAYNSMGNYDLALSYYKESIDMKKIIFKNIANPAEAASLNNIGAVYQSKGQYNLALKYYQESLAIDTTVFKDSAHLEVSTSLNNIGTIYELQGEYDLALKYLKESLDMQNAVMNDVASSNTANTLHRIGSVYESKGDYDLALQYFKASLDMEKTLKSNSHPDVACSLNNIGDIYHSKGEYDLALKYYEECLGIEKSVFKDIVHPAVATSMNNIGVVFKSKREYDLSLKYFTESLNIRKAVFKGVAHPDVASSLLNIGSAYESKGNYDFALKSYFESLAIVKALFRDVEHIYVANSLSFIAGAYKQKGKYDLALQYYKESLAVQKAVFQTDIHPAIAISLNSIGHIHHIKGEYDLALNYYSECLEMRKRLFPSTAHPNVATALNNIGVAHQAKGEFDLALKYLEEGLAMRKALSHPGIASSLNNIGFTHHLKGDIDLALKYYIECLNMQKVIFNNEAHQDIATLLNNIAGAYESKGDYNSALEYHKEGLATWKKLFKDVAHPSVAASLKNIGAAYQSMREYDLALKYFKECLDVEKICFDEATHPAFATSLTIIGLVYHLKGDYDLALEHYMEGFKMQKAIFKTVPHPDIANSLHNLGSVYQSKGEYDLALEYHKQCLEVRNAVFKGEAHPAIAISLKNIAAAYNSKGEYDLAIQYNEKSTDVKNKFLETKRSLQKNPNLKHFKLA